MTQWLTLSRAAHLLGISRVACKSASATGELPSFDGMVDADELQRAWPQLDLEESGSFEKTRAIREDAFAKRLRERVLPSQEALAQRLFAQGQELAELQRTLTRYHQLIEDMRARLERLPQALAEELGHAARRGPGTGDFGAGSGGRSPRARCYAAGSCRPTSRSSPPGASSSSKARNPCSRRRCAPAWRPTTVAATAIAACARRAWWPARRALVAPRLPVFRSGKGAEPHPDVCLHGA
jgi:hypothetical protein